jgi:hypothetical protein
MTRVGTLWLDPRGRKGFKSSHRRIDPGLRSAVGREAPGGQDEIAGLRELAPFELPPEYVELLRYGDGGFGERNAAPLLFRMDSVAESVTRNEMWRREGQFGRFWFIGGNGGLESITLRVH